MFIILRSIDGEYHGEDRKEKEEESYTESNVDYEDILGYDNDASLMLDYELAETSRQYLNDEMDGTDGNIGTARMTSGKKIIVYFSRIVNWIIKHRHNICS